MRRKSPKVRTTKYGPETNTFTIDVPACIGQNQANTCDRWLNRQWTGKPIVPLNRRPPKALQEAASRMRMVRVVRLTIEVQKDGTWKLLESKKL
jgi:hypothetical protein